MFVVVVEHYDIPSGKHVVWSHTVGPYRSKEVAESDRKLWDAVDNTNAWIESLITPNDFNQLIFKDD